LSVIAPTKLYGYAAGGEDAKPQDELSYIGQVWGKYYSELQDVAVPVSKTNFDVYGASTTPTLVLIDRTGKVAMYHPGAMSYEDLHAAIEKVLTR
jgi:thioredoxin-related protein